MASNHRLITLILSLCCIFFCDKAYADIRTEKYNNLSLTDSGSNESVDDNELHMTDKIDNKSPMENDNDMGTTSKDKGTPDVIESSSGLAKSKLNFNLYLRKILSLSII